MERLTTDDPKGNYQWLHNMTVIKDGEVFIRDYDNGEDLSIVNYCKKECKSKCDIDIEVGAEEFGEYMDCDCPVSLLYHMAVGHAELRQKLAAYEDNQLSPKEVKALIESKPSETEAIELRKEVAKVKLEYLKLKEVIARNLVAWDTSKDKAKGLLPEVYLSNLYWYKQLTGEEYNFSKACKKFNIGD